MEAKVITGTEHNLAGSSLGGKHVLERPRMRSVGQGREAELESYRAFQGDGRMQRAVAGKLIRQVSTRNYEGAQEDCLEGYGIKKSSLSRQWKAATSAELEKLCRRPVPHDLVALVIDGKHLRQDCAVVALGVDEGGNKHVLGLWHGASENATVVKALLEDLGERGLDPTGSMLVVIDGAKALGKAVCVMSLATVPWCSAAGCTNVVMSWIIWQRKINARQPCN